MNGADKNNFPLEAKTKLLSLGWTVSDLARKLRRPRETVSVAIHHENKFPRVRAAVAKKLGLTLPR